MTPLMFVANRGLLSITPVFHGKGGSDCICFELGHVECAIALLLRSARIDDRDIHDSTALMFASMNNDLDMVGLLLGFRAEVDSWTDLGWTSLCAACCLGHAHVVGLLLEARADANRRQEDGAVPLHFAAFRGRTEVVTCLLGAGADRYEADRTGDLMGGQTDVLRLLLRD